MTIEIELGKYDIIEIHIDDDPHSLARDFLLKHKLDLKILDLLTKNINDAKENAIKENSQLMNGKNKTSKSFSEQFPSIFFQNLPYFELFIYIYIN